MSSVFPRFVQNDRQFPQKPWNDWAVARGYGINENTLHTAYALPGLALSSMKVMHDPDVLSLAAVAKGMACIR